MENKKNITIKFFSPVNMESASALMQVIDQAIKEGISQITLLLSTPGGDVAAGISLYNYLKGIPIEKIITHNFGSVDSIGVVVFCAGSERFSSPQARFIIHGIQINFNQPTSLEESQLAEKLDGMKMDIENISKIIAKNTNKDSKDVETAMQNKIVLNPEAAKEWGLIGKIQTQLFNTNSQIISILSPDSQHVIINKPVEIVNN